MFTGHLGIARIGHRRIFAHDTARRAGLAGVLLVLVAALGVAPVTAAEDEPKSKKLDLTVRNPNDPDMWLLPSLRFDQVYFAGAHAWGGNTKESIGNKSNGWAEYGLVPAVDGHVSLGDKGTLTARVSGVWTTTQLGLDWAGSNFYDGNTHKPEEFTLEDAYLKWSSGQVFSGLGEDAVEVSVGSQVYNVGNGFIFGNAGSDGGNRGGYWLGLRNAFELAAITRLKTGEFDGDVVYFRSDDRGGDHTQGAGSNLDYDLGKYLGVPSLKLGFGYWNVFSSQDARRNGLNVINVRLETAPVPDLKGLVFQGEYAKEKNRQRNDSFAAYGGVAYDFAENEVALSPYASYRFAYFSGDDQSGQTDNSFDPLFYTFNDWNQWYIGEIAGEWVTGNSNINANIFRVRLNPIDAVTLHLFYVYLRLSEKQSNVEPPGGHPVDPRVAAINDKSLSHEVDFITDWSVNNYLSTSFVAAALIPDDGAKDFFANDEVWLQFMFYASIKF